MKRLHKKYITGLLILLAAVCIITYILYRYNYIPHKKYTSQEFEIKAYISETDKDSDSIDDQTDILKSAREYVATKPKYKSKYYATGYPDDEYGVCTDVVANALLHSGYDLMELVNRDIMEYPQDYDIEKPDINIDFRRVRNLNVYFRHTAISLTTDITDIEEWQGGDIVVFEKHIGIVSDMRNKKGIPFVIHHVSPSQNNYEEDILESYGTIIGHYRIS